MISSLTSLFYQFSWPSFLSYQARERQRKEEQEQLEREAAEAERKRREEEEAQERAAREAAEREAALARVREEKAISLGAEPERGPDVTQVNPQPLSCCVASLQHMLFDPSVLRRGIFFFFFVLVDQLCIKNNCAYTNLQANALYYLYLGPNISSLVVEM